MTEPRTTQRRRLAAAVIVVAVAAIAGALVLYGTGQRGGKDEASCPAASREAAARLSPFARGEVAAMNVAKNPHMAIDVAFTGADGAPKKLSDFRGRAVLLNLWATWCVPCRAEMPALDKLEGKLGGPDFQVIALNIDTARLDRPKAFLNEVGVKNLTYYADPSADSFEALRVAGKALGLPTSLLIDARGCELSVIAGPANWDSDDAIKAIRAALGA
jgi:thiol-disulfide isomerase/thioredoxin